MHRRTKDPPMWAAGRLHRVLSERALKRERGGEQFASAVQALLQHQKDVARRWTRACKASLHGWTSAAVAERGLLTELVRSTHYYVDDVLGHRSTEPQPAPPLRDILGELRQLDDEFDEVSIQFRPALIAVVTKPVTLEGIRLGRFRVSLQLDRLADRQDVTVFDCVALDPNPAATSEDTTHPHVRGEVLCSGEATAPLGAALRQGRVCDAFLLINAVLHTYNGGSAYISLEDWDGVGCADCGCARDPDSIYRCQSCEDDLCEECISSCDACRESYCQHCLERERGDGEYLCSGCRATCPRCGLVASAGDVEEQGLCNHCYEEEQEEERERERKLQEEQQEEQDHDDDCESDEIVTTATADQTEVEGAAREAPAA